MEEIKLNKNQKKYIWIFPVLSIVMSVLAWTFFLYRNFVGKFFGAVDKSWFDVMFLYFLIALILGIIGLVIGIKRRKTGGRLSAVLGIIMPIVAIALTIFFGFMVELSIILRTT